MPLMTKGTTMTITMITIKREAKTRIDQEVKGQMTPESEEKTNEIGIEIGTETRIKEEKQMTR